MNIENLLIKYNNGKSRGGAKKLADKLDISPSAMSQILDGRMKIPKDLLPKIAKELGINVDQLMACFAQRNAAAHGVREGGWQYQGHHADVTGPEQSVDFTEVIGVVSAETFKEPMEDAVRLDVIDYLHKKKAGRRIYALRISGSCMEPKASDGDHAIIEEATDVPDGALAVICWDGECTLKRVYHRSDHLELRPDNPEYKILRPKLKDCRIIGIVKSFQRKP